MYLVFFFQRVSCGGVCRSACLRFRISEGINCATLCVSAKIALEQRPGYGFRKDPLMHTFSALRTETPCSKRHWSLLSYAKAIVFRIAYLRLPSFIRSAASSPHHTDPRPVLNCVPKYTQGYNRNRRSVALTCCVWWTGRWIVTLSIKTI